MSITIAFPVGYKPVLKHGDHDQSSHGSWATGAELADWNPTGSVPESPRNAGGMTPKSWEAWEHGPDGQNFIALFRKYACEELGLEVPKTPFDEGGYLNYMMDRGWGKPSRDEAKGMLNAIANGKPQPALYRGMTESSDPQDQASLDALLSTKPGDTFDMPLVSTSRSLGVATWYAADTPGVGKNSVVMKIQEGAKGVALKKENSTYPQDHEVITSGKFEVVSVNKVATPYWSRSIFEPRFTPGDAEYPDTYQIATYDKTRFTPEQAKTAWEAVSNGNYKSLETPTFKLTQDRNGKGLSSWTKQEGREFTVIEVKMVEPHTVQKAKSYGNDFFNLFNNMPFIHDEAEDVGKHGEHDQSSHGSWATGQGDFDDEKDYDAAYSTYSEKYGVDKEGNTVGISDEEIGAIEDYTSEGYKGINSMLRAGSSLYEISQEERIEYLSETSTSTGERAEQEFREKNDFPDNYELTPPEVETAYDNYARVHRDEIDSYVLEVKEFPYNDDEFTDRIISLDKTIGDAPVLFGDKNLYRAMSNNVLEGMKEGDIVTDRGYLSTTRANLTVDTFTREQLGSIKDSTDDTVAVILPNASKSGKGFAVDMWAKLSNRETDTRNREQEILLPRDTPLKFLGYKTDVGTEARVAVFQRMDK